MSTSTWQGLWRRTGVQPKPDTRNEQPGSVAGAPREGRGEDTGQPRRPGSLPDSSGGRGWRRGRGAQPSWAEAQGCGPRHRMGRQVPKPGQATQLLRVRPSLGGSDGKSGAGGGAGILHKPAESDRGRGPASSGRRVRPSAAPGRAAAACFPVARVPGLCHLRGSSGCTRGRGAGWPLLRRPSEWTLRPPSLCRPPFRHKQAIH